MKCCLAFSLFLYIEVQSQIPIIDCGKFPLLLCLDHVSVPMVYIYITKLFKISKENKKESDEKETRADFPEYDCLVFTLN